jgi:hypothetical protein
MEWVLPEPVPPTRRILGPGILIMSDLHANGVGRGFAEPVVIEIGNVVVVGDGAEFLVGHYTEGGCVIVPGLLEEFNKNATRDLNIFVVKMDSDFHGEAPR